MISQSSSAGWHAKERKSVRGLLLGTGDINTEMLGDHSAGDNFCPQITGVPTNRERESQYVNGGYNLRVMGLQIDSIFFFQVILTSLKLIFSTMVTFAVK